MKVVIQTPRDFFDLIVTPDVNDFVKSQGNIRFAFHACMSLDHMRDWVANFLGIGIGSFSDDVYKMCPAVEVIRNISVNAKHFPPTRAPVITTMVSAKPISIDAITVSIDDMLGTLDDYGAGLQVIAKEPGRSDDHVLLLVNEVFVFWRNYLSKHAGI